MTCNKQSAIVAMGGSVDLRCRIGNRARYILDSKDNYFISYHVEDRHGKILVWDNPRVSFPKPLAPGAAETVVFRVRAPVGPAGEYALQMDIVHERVAWLSQHGVVFPVLTLTVTARAPPTLPASVLANPPTSVIASNDNTLSHAWQEIADTIDRDRSEITVRGGKYTAFAAGQAYPQVWIRDCATIFDAARWFVGREDLRGCLVLHFEAQAADGSVQDWVDTAGSTDKNTVETDQEASLVQLLSKYVAATGDRAFLSERIDRITVLQRADNALAYAWRERLDRKFGLLTSGHTIDWGDVQIGEVDKPIYRDKRTAIVVGVYTQAMFVIAAKDLIRLYDLDHADDARIQLWRERVNILMARTREALWDGKRGYFLVHRHVTPLSHSFDEDDIFAMGGNAVAIEAGLATPEMARSIFSTAVARQSRFGISTISGVVLPPYPSGTYSSPVVSQPYSYQNGGQWDWFGGRLVLEMYQEGYTTLASRKLYEILAKNVKNGDIFEWEHRDGSPGGKGDFAGGAGVLARAISEGLFGIDWRGDRVSLILRLANKAERATFAQPATSNSLGLDYSTNALGRNARLVIFPEGLKLDSLSVLAPVAGATFRNVMWNGHPTGFSVHRTGSDVFLDPSPARISLGRKMELRFDY